jgi:molybdenum cofactor synthesis domain-containing protein
MSIRVTIIVASNRAAAGIYEDTSGPILVDGLTTLGHQVDGPVVVPDGEPVGDAIKQAIANGADVVITSGGTGISPTDRTPQITKTLIEYEIPGIAEALRGYGATKVPSAVLSRGIAGVAGRTLIVNLPGSTGGAKDGLAVLGPILNHAVDQLKGGDHASSHAHAPARPGPTHAQDPAAGHHAQDPAAGHHAQEGGDQG